MPKSISLEQLARLSPSIIGTIRWKSTVGKPSGELCDGFSILVEEHTSTQFRAVGGGKYEPIPGTGIWKVIAESVACRDLSSEDDHYAVGFHITGLHLTAFPDGQYRVTPSLQGTWRPGGILALLARRVIEPISASIILTDDKRIQSVEFEVVRRSFFSGRRLGT
jgi:hypothetical protein